MLNVSKSVSMKKNLYILNDPSKLSFNYSFKHIYS